MARTSCVVLAMIAALLHATASGAVSLNPRGLGEVLVYPYYTVQKNQDTLVSIGNSTQWSKVVAVVVREGMNGRPVLYFTLYLSPHDVWTARISATGEDGGAFLVTQDASCTSPALALGGTPFWSETYAGPAYPPDGGPTGIERTREGMIEFIELARVAPFSALDQTIVHGQTGTPGEGVPDCDPQVFVESGYSDLIVPDGGLFGSASIVNVGEGTFFAYNADALVDFSDMVLPGEDYMPPRPPDEYMTMANSADSPAGGASATLVDDDGRMLALRYTSGIDAVSAVFMADAVYNEVLTAAGLGASTDWILTFPTRAFYVDARHGGVAAAWPPFAEPVVAARSDVAVYPFGYDQEEGFRPCLECEISPPPPQTPTLLSWQVNALSFRDITRGDAPSNVLGSRLTTSFEPYGDAGWVHINLAGGDGGHALPPDASGTVLHGLPVTGFMVYNIINANAAPGRLANYGGVFPHRATVEHSQVPAHAGD
jgi:hypothetical protein